MCPWITSYDPHMNLRVSLPALQTGSHCLGAGPGRGSTGGMCWYCQAPCSQRSWPERREWRVYSICKENKPCCHFLLVTVSGQPYWHLSFNTRMISKEASPTQSGKVREDVLWSAASSLWVSCGGKRTLQVWLMLMVFRWGWVREFLGQLTTANSVFLRWRQRKKRGEQSNAAPSQGKSGHQQLREQGLSGETWF